MVPSQPLLPLEPESGPLLPSLCSLLCPPGLTCGPHSGAVVTSHQVEGRKPHTLCPSLTPQHLVPKCQIKTCPAALDGAAGRGLRQPPLSHPSGAGREVGVRAWGGERAWHSQSQPVLAAGPWVELQPPTGMRAAWGRGRDRKASAIGSLLPEWWLLALHCPRRGSPQDVCGVPPVRDPSASGCHGKGWMPLPARASLGGGTDSRGARARK